MTPPDLRVVVEISASGTLRRDAATGEWFIEGDDERLYLPATEIPEALLIDGARVAFQGTILSEPTEDSDYTIVELQNLVLVL